LVRQIKENDEYSPIRVVPIILLSNSDDPESKLAGYEIGVEDFFVKPYNFLEILTRIKALMRAQDLTEQLLQREHRMTLIESLNDSLIYFSKNLRPPMLDLIAKSNLLLSTYSENNYSQIIEFCKQVKANAELTISTLDRLEGRVHELLSKDQQLKSSQLTPQALEEQYRSHFIRHQEQFLRLHDTPQEDSCYGDSQK